MQSSPDSSHFLPLSPKYFLQHSVLKHPDLSSSLSMRDHVFYPYKTTGKINL